MAKSKNHTAHNQTYKQHKNGIKKQKKFRYSSRKGVRSFVLLPGRQARHSDALHDCKSHHLSWGSAPSEVLDT